MARVFHAAYPGDYPDKIVQNFKCSVCGSTDLQVSFHLQKDDFYEIVERLEAAFCNGCGIAYSPRWLVEQDIVVAYIFGPPVIRVQK